MTTRTTFLAEIPFPLLPPSETFICPPTIPTQTPEPKDQHTFDEQRYQAIFDALVDLSEIAPHSGNNSTHLFVKEYGLHQVFGDLYHTSARHTVFLRVAAAHRALKNYQPPTIRFSRQTAAWIWGYLPNPNLIHLDFDRGRRMSPQAAKHRKISFHQIRTYDEHDTIHFIHNIYATSPLKTILDLLQYENETDSIPALTNFLHDPKHAITIDQLHSILENQRFIQNRAHALSCLNQVKRNWAGR